MGERLLLGEPENAGDPRDHRGPREGCQKGAGILHKHGQPFLHRGGQHQDTLIPRRNGAARRAGAFACEHRPAARQHAGAPRRGRQRQARCLIVAAQPLIALPVRVAGDREPFADDFFGIILLAQAHSAHDQDTVAALQRLRHRLLQAAALPARLRLVAQLDA